MKCSHACGPKKNKQCNGKIKEIFCISTRHGETVSYPTCAKHEKSLRAVLPKLRKAWGSFLNKRVS